MTLPPGSTPVMMKRTVSSGSAVSHMDLQITHHWNDAVAPSKLQSSRSVSPLPLVSDEEMRRSVSSVIDAKTRLSSTQHKTHVDKVNSALKVATLTQEQRIALKAALERSTPELKRKAIVEFIRENDGVIRWAASLRALAESTEDG